MKPFLFFVVLGFFCTTVSYAQTSHDLDDTSGPYSIFLRIHYYPAQKKHPEKFVVQGYGQFTSDNGMIEVLKILPTTLDDTHTKTHIVENNIPGRFNKSIWISKFVSKSLTRNKKYIDDTYHYKIDFSSWEKKFNPSNPEDVVFVELAPGISIKMSSDETTCEDHCGSFNFTTYPNEFYIGVRTNSAPILKKKLDVKFVSNE